MAAVHVVGLEGSNRSMEPSVDAFDQWARPHLQAMANLAARLGGPADRDDVVQESLTRAWRRFETYRPDRGSPRSWLLAIVADQARRGRARRARAAFLPPPAGPASADLDLERAVRSLPPRQRLAVELHYFLDLDVAGTAAVMGCAEGTVKSSLADARARLRTLLEGS
jgi:DNA-directed RNA polymerase specialized sigma24 family protein